MPPPPPAPPPAPPVPEEDDEEDDGAGVMDSSEPHAKKADADAASAKTNGKARCMAAHLIRGAARMRDGSAGARARGLHGRRFSAARRSRRRRRPPLRCRA